MRHLGPQGWWSTWGGKGWATKVWCKGKDVVRPILGFTPCMEEPICLENVGGLRDTVGFVVELRALVAGRGWTQLRRPTQRILDRRLVASLRTAGPNDWASRDIRKIFVQYVWKFYVHVAHLTLKSLLLVTGIPRAHTLLINTNLPILIITKNTNAWSWYLPAITLSVEICSEPCFIDMDGVVTPFFHLLLHKFALATLMISYNLSVRKLVPQTLGAIHFHSLRASLFHFIANCVGDHNFFRNPRAIIINKTFSKITSDKEGR